MVQWTSKKKYITILTASIGTDRPLQPVQNAVSDHGLHCLPYSNILDTSTLVEWTISNLWTSMVSRYIALDMMFFPIQKY